MKRQEVKLEVLYYNTRGLANEDRLVEFETALEKVRWNIVGTSEVCKEGEGLIKRKNGNYLYYYGETKGQKEVGFYIRNEIWRKITESKKISERTCLLKMEIDENRELLIVQVYAPTLEAEEEELDKFYTTLQQKEW